LGNQVVYNLRNNLASCRAVVVFAAEQNIVRVALVATPVQQQAWIAGIGVLLWPAV
jgi:hypothetical protein